MKQDKDASALGQILFPFKAFGTTTLPQQKTYLIKNATVWTNEADGVIENADVLLRNGKIAQVGKNLSANGATKIDGTVRQTRIGRLGKAWGRRAYGSQKTMDALS